MFEVVSDLHLAADSFVRLFALLDLTANRK
jgi:hypothetical protein